MLKKKKYLQMDDRILLEKCCRICRANVKNVQSIFQELYMGKRPVDMLKHCLQHSIATEDSFPTNICEECTTKLISAHEFLVICEESEKYYSLLSHRVTKDSVEAKSELVTCTPGNRGLSAVSIKSEQTDQSTNVNDKMKSKFYECFDCKRIYRRLKDLRWHIKNHEMASRGIYRYIYTRNRF